LAILTTDALWIPSLFITCRKCSNICGLRILSIAFLPMNDLIDKKNYKVRIKLVAYAINLYIQTQSPARIHYVIGIKVFFKAAQNIHLGLSQMIFHPWSKHPAYPVVMT